MFLTGINSYWLAFKWNNHFTRNISTGVTKFMPSFCEEKLLNFSSQWLLRVNLIVTMVLDINFKTVALLQAHQSNILLIYIYYNLCPIY